MQVASNDRVRQGLGVHALSIPGCIIGLAQIPTPTAPSLPTLRERVLTGVGAQYNWFARKWIPKGSHPLAGGLDAVHTTETKFKRETRVL